MKRPPDKSIVYERRNESEVIVVYVNLGENKYDLFFDSTMYDLITTATLTNKVTVLPNSYSILSNKRI